MVEEKTLEGKMKENQNWSREQIDDVKTAIKRFMEEAFYDDDGILQPSYNYTYDYKKIFEEVFGEGLCSEEEKE